MTFFSISNIVNVVGQFMLLIMKYTYLGSWLFTFWLMSYLFTFSVRCLFTFQRLGSIDGSSTIGRSSSLSQEKQGIIQDNFEESKYRVNKTVWWTQHKNLLELASTYHFFIFVHFGLIFQASVSKIWIFYCMYVIGHSS